MSNNQRKNLSCTVPKKVADKLQLIADHEGHLMSRKICKVLTDYIKDQEKIPHPALEKEAENEKD
jgi:hypothetical protein